MSGLEWAPGVERRGARGSIVLYKYACHAYIKSALHTKGAAVSVQGVFHTHLQRARGSGKVSVRLNSTFI